MGVSYVTQRRNADAAWKAVGAYALETDTLAEQAKRIAEAAFVGDWQDRQIAGLNARDEVKNDRRKGHDRLVAKRDREQHLLVTWKPAPKKERPVEAFSAIVVRRVARP